MSARLLASLIVLLCLFATSQVNAAKPSENKVVSSEKAVQLINLNTADLKTLKSLPGIGKNKAQAIISYRDEKGKINSVEQLAEIRGFGKGSIAKLSKLVTF